MSILNRQILLPDNRKLGYDEYGTPAGKPLIYFHGSPSSRFENTLYLNEHLLQSLDVRLIAVDRPGMGLSSFQPQRRILDWPRDVLALANHLNLERFSILAYSLGGPYGAACGFALPERISKVGIVSGAALFTEVDLLKNVNQQTRRFLNLPRENPLASRMFLMMMLGVMPRLAPNRFITGALSTLPEPDRKVVESDPEFQKGFIKMVREAMRQGTRGAHHESLLTITDWGFRLQDIQTPVLLWHGELDKNIPVEMARFMGTVIPNCIGKYYPDEGHLSLFKKYSKEIIQTLAS